jgi:hypothetical protein
LPWLPPVQGGGDLLGQGAGGWQPGRASASTRQLELAAGALHRDADRLGAVTSFMVTLFGSGR